MNKKNKLKLLSTNLKILNVLSNPNFIKSQAGIHTKIDRHSNNDLSFALGVSNRKKKLPTIGKFVSELQPQEFMQF